jgi:hypothetical protein
MVTTSRSSRTPARRLRRGAASSFVVGSRRRVGQFALPSPLPRVARLLTVVAFTRGVPARHGDLLLGTFRRPPTSCAHRLRKPDRTHELLALSVARWTRVRGLRPAASSAPKGGIRITTAPLRDAVTGHFHRARPAVAAVGLERRPPAKPERLPSDRARALRPEWARPRLLFTRTASPRTLSLAASLGLPRQGQTGRLELPRDSREPPCDGRVTPRERCVSPTSATDSRHEHPTDCSIPGCALSSAGSPWACAGGGEVWEASSTACRMSQPSGASLDGEPPASALPRSSRGSLRRAREPRSEPEPQAST